MSKMCHEYAIAYCPLGIEIYCLKKRKDHLRYFKVAINTLSQESQGKKNGNRLHVLDINYKDDTEDS